MKKSKIIGIISGIFIFILILGGLTYAYYVWKTSSEDETKIVTKLGVATVHYNGGSSISDISLKPTASKEEGISKKIIINTDGEIVGNLYFNLYLDINSLDEGLKEESFKYELYSDDELITNGNFSVDSLSPSLVECQNNNTSHIVLLNNRLITTEKTNYTLYLWIDGNENNPNTMQNKLFSFALHADGQNAKVDEPINAAQYITNLYLSNKNGTVTNNSIEYSIAPDVSLMNDRLGGTTEDLDGGNIRYYGATPNNYVWLGDIYAEDMTIYGNITEDGYESKEACIEDGNSIAYCTDDVEVHAGDKKLWRIIGVFDGKLKLVTDVPISTQGLSWDTSASTVNNGYGVNEWSQSDLMKLLNPGYQDEPVNKSLYWTKGSGTVYNGQNNSTTSNISFTNTGLLDSEKNMIEEVTWYTGAYNNTSYADVHYKAEREDMGKICSSTGTYGSYCNDTVTRTKEWPGKVGLISASDYGYSVDLNSCNYKLDNYWQDDCSLNNWLVNGRAYWTMSPHAHSDHASIVFLVNYIGYLGHDYASYDASVRPAVYLKSGVTISSGNGSQSDPYELSYQ